MADRRVRGMRSLMRGRSGAVRDSPERSMDPRSAGDEPPSPRSHVIDNAIYVNGRRTATPGSLPEAFECLKNTPDSMAWIGFYRPEDAVILNVAEEFDLHELAVEDAIVAHQRPKADRYGDTLFVVLRPARYVDEAEEVDFGELHLFVGRNFVITVRHSEAPDLSQVRRRMEGDPELLGQGPQAVLYAIMDAVVDGYAPVVAGLQNDIDEIEVQVFGNEPGVSRRIYELSREVIEFQRATGPLLGMIEGFIAGAAKYGVDQELQRYLRDVADHAITVAERVSGFRQMLHDILVVNSTMVAQAQNEHMTNLTEASNAQNEEVKKISAWAAILFAPTLVGTIYGMNFDDMPEIHWDLGYPFAVLLMAGVCTTLYVVFKRRDWL
ncbi:magnesium and cobalt transport protein CorA [Streptosporangium roseum]|uniref:Magnesium/cobalt transporter CorA n=1 Tax=Streptosporangium roseum (strain ATCC 12428 / DSM 43021 / JCM 3005 / KCTC 9067 / NCIMB 10171 / NRRL 2505 / NI 9100) TaxID=479432 RepID=D2B0D6_STRRD|nr:magnesium and cobalt transport protein CorA [Streptosporangium roseum]ACZ89142.1 magnesium/cobalt transporter CorA [Streptosporangium roseum DSM 43021]